MTSIAKGAMSSTQGSDHSKPLQTVYLANMAEDVWSFIEHLPDKEQQTEIQGCAQTSDRELVAFLSEPHPILILPEPVEPAFTKYLHQLRPDYHFRALIPKHHSGQISLDCINDTHIINQLAQANQTHQLSLLSYTASPQFYQLVNFLKQNQFGFITPQSPDQINSWTANYFGSKVGFRDFYNKHHADHPAFRMAEGNIAPNFDTAIKQAFTFYTTKKGVVLKTTKAHSGIGVIILKSGDLPTDEAGFQKALHHKLDHLPYWHHLPITVEEYLPVDQSIAGGTPNAECFIDQNGKTHFLYSCGMRIDQTGEIMGESGAFMGVEFGQDAVQEHITKQLYDLGMFLGNHYAQEGYRGYFDVDCLIDQNSKLYITESNTRRTGGTHVYHLAKSLLGDQFAQKYMLSNNYYPLPQGYWDLPKVLSRCQSILYDNAFKTGFVVAAANTLQTNYLTYAIIADSKQEAVDLETQMGGFLRT